MSEKKYIINNEKLMTEWNWEKNNLLSLTPQQLTYGSSKKVWWKCDKGHEWQSIISHRTQGSGCPFCSGRYAIKGKNDLQTVNPFLANEWNYDKNEDLKPEDFTANSTKKVWWKCQIGHEWQAVIESRNSGMGCPYCSGRYTIKGENDLQTINPSLASEWNYKKNNKLTPSDVMPNSRKKVWWKCQKGHEWQATVQSRNQGRGCPICNSERNTSLPEYAILFYLQKHNLEVLHSYKKFGYELDIYIPSLKIAIEYDGCFWHKDKTRKDLEKNLKCKQDGIKLYRIREGLSSLNDSSIDYIIQENQKDLAIALKNILRDITKTDIDINLHRDMIDIESLREYTEKKDSLLVSNPDVAKEWNYERNGTLKPESFFANSGKKVWWKCDKGHEWQATIYSRNNGSGCPYCSNRKILKGYNDLQSANSILSKEWNYKKNGQLKPENFSSKSTKKVWWICKKGHEWQASIADRNNGTQCPYCLNKKIIQGYNDLTTHKPTLAKEWNYEKNGNLKPEQVSVNSGKKVWWKCPKGHEWETSIKHRSMGRGCPYCSGRYAIKGENDLQTINPSLASEWNFEKNNELSPSDVLPSSNKKVWWKCKNNHEWQATISHRTNGTGCPICYKINKHKKGT